MHNCVILDAKSSLLTFVRKKITKNQKNKIKNPSSNLGPKLNPSLNLGSSCAIELLSALRVVRQHLQKQEN
jgi:hypothetical protein